MGLVVSWCGRGRRPLERTPGPPGETSVLVIDEVGYLPFERQAANLLFQLVTAGTSGGHHPHSTSQWGTGEVFGTTSWPRPSWTGCSTTVTSSAFKGDSTPAREADVRVAAAGGGAGPDAAAPRKETQVHLRQWLRVATLPAGEGAGHG